MNDDSEYPRLTPPDDRYPWRDRLVRKPEDLTWEQFDLLAAAWSEGALDTDSFSDLNAAMAADSSLKLRAESFRRVRLSPYNDRWPGRNRLLKTSPATTAIRRTIFLTVASAAAVVALIVFGPSVINQVTGKTIPPSSVTTEIAEILIPGPKPVIISGEKADEPADYIAGINAAPASAGKSAGLNAATASYDPKTSTEETAGTKASTAGGEGEMAARAVETAGETRPINTDHAVVASLMIAGAGDTQLRPLEMTVSKAVALQMSSSPELSKEPRSIEKETNWVIRSVSALAKAITREDKKIDGYFVASACVKGINNALGWEMQLEQATNNEGEPVAVSFSSSLLSFSAPVNKTSQ